VVGLWILDFGLWILDFGFWILDFRFWSCLKQAGEGRTAGLDGFWI
jgi:hypothetical protein